MGAHTQGINTNSENIFQSLDLHIRMVGATGNFTIGEVITGSTSAATATLTFVNVNPAERLTIDCAKSALETIAVAAEVPPVMVSPTEKPRPAGP